MKKIIKIFIVILLLFPLSVFAKDKKVKLYLFHGDGCPHCREEIEFLDKIKDDYPNLEIVKYEVWYNEDNAELLGKVEDTFDVTNKGVPTNVIGSTVISGYSEAIGNKLKRAIDYYQKNDYEDIVSKIKDGSYKGTPEDNFSKEDEMTDEDFIVKVPFIKEINLKNFSLISAAVIIGFVDGFNPCAMWVLLFLISVLVGMKNRKRMWALGLTFLVTSALVYMIIILSFIKVLSSVKIDMSLTTIIWIRNIIAIFALIGGLINLRSFLRERKESGCEVVDEKKRKKIFSKIKKFTSEKNFLLALIGVIGLAISVNLVELTCSAGLPSVFSGLLIMNNVSGTDKILYTFIYIFFFLIDDLIVFFIAMITMNVTGISTKYNKFSHLIGGIIMLLVGILLLFKPGWLMFNFK